MMRGSHFYSRFGLVTLSGCLWFLASTPFDLSVLAWIAAVPLLFAVDRAPTLRQALFLGWWAGVIETGGGFYWLIDLMQRFGHFPWVAAALVFLLFCAARALMFLLFAGIVCGIRRRQRLPMSLLGPSVMVACEFLVPQLFPSGQWITQAWHPLVIQITELTGPLGVTALLMMVNGAIYDLLVDARAARRAANAARHAAIAAALILAAALIFGAVRMRQVDDLIARAPRLKIGLVQPNFAYTMDGQFSRDEALRQLTALQTQSRRLERAGAHLLVWSEGSYPVALPHDVEADFAPASLAMIRRDIGIPLVIGASTYDATNDAAFNTALLLDRRGQVVGRYDKVWLLAFGEYMPWVETFPWLRNLVPQGAARFTPGTGPAVMALQDSTGPTWSLGAVICYEDILPDFLRGVGKLHPNLLVNLTSDSWFGASTEPFEHLALSVFASLELRVSMVRAVNSGISALIDPNGRVLRKTYADDPFREPRAADGILVEAPGLPGGHTLFVAWGNWFAYLCIATTLILAGLAHFRHRSPHRAAPWGP